MGTDRFVGTEGVQIEQTRAVGIVDILRHGKGEAETARPHIVGTLVEGLGTVVISERNGGTVFRSVVETAGDEFLGVAHGGRHHPIKGFH